MTTFLTQMSDYLASPDIPRKKFSIVSYYLLSLSAIKTPGADGKAAYLSDEFFEQYEEKLLSLA